MPGLKAAVSPDDVTLIVLGTPAEENIGGKAMLLEAGALPVVKGDRLIGIVTESDLLRYFASLPTGKRKKCRSKASWFCHCSPASISPCWGISRAAACRCPGWRRFCRPHSAA